MLLSSASCQHASALQILASSDDEDTDDAEDDLRQAEEARLEQEQIRSLEAEIRELEADQAEVQEKLDAHNAFAEMRRRSLEAQRDAIATRRGHVIEDLENLKGTPDDEEEEVRIPPGPHCLHWVSSNQFKFLCMVVIIINVSTMTLELIKGNDFWAMGQFFLCFYLMELILNVLLWRDELVIGPCRIVWWNWLDIIIVATGILDAWILPLARSSSGNSSLVYLRYLRLARLIRIMKIIRIFMRTDLSFIEAPRFQGFIMGCIGFNAVLLGLEDILPDASSIWFWCNQVLQFIFTFELICRLKLAGCRFFYRHPELMWNYLDSVIVVGGIIDLWIITPLEYVLESGMGGQKGLVSTLRLVRLLRIARVVRLVRRIPPLFTLIAGIAHSMAGMGWVLVLTLSTLYVCSLLMLNLAGSVLDQEAAESAFPDLGTAVFNLFMVMNADVSSMEIVFERNEWMRGVVMCFMVVTNWAIFSILTAVVSDNMNNVTERYQQEEEERSMSDKVKVLKRRLSELFIEAGCDREGKFTRQEFENMFKNEILIEEFENITERSWEDILSILHLLTQKDPQDCEIERDEFIEFVVHDLSLFRVTRLILDMEGAIDKKLERMQRAIDCRSSENFTRDGTPHFNRDVMPLSHDPTRTLSVSR